MATLSELPGNSPADVVSSVMILHKEPKCLPDGFIVGRDVFTPELKVAMIAETRALSFALSKEINTVSGIFQAPSKLESEKIVWPYLLVSMKKYAGCL